VDRNGGKDFVFLPWRDGEEGDDVNEVGHDVYAKQRKKEILLKLEVAI